MKRCLERRNTAQKSINIQDNSWYSRTECIGWYGLCVVMGKRDRDVSVDTNITVTTVLE